MPSYLVTGVNRGIGWEFLRQLSDDASNIVVGTARNKAATDKKIAQELGNRPNIHIVEVEITDYESIKKSVADVSKVTDGKLDYIIANAGLISEWSGFDPIGKLGETPKELEDDLLQLFKVNVVGNIHLFNFYLPLIRKGDVKKVITISSGLADIDLVSEYTLDIAAPYSISKTAVNMAVAKFHAQYSEEGILFMSISPGVVNTGYNDHLMEDQAKGLAKMAGKFNEYAPGFKVAEPHESVSDVLKVVYNASLEKGNGGSFVSHFGNKKWL